MVFNGRNNDGVLRVSESVIVPEEAPSESYDIFTPERFTAETSRQLPCTKMVGPK